MGKTTSLIRALGSIDDGSTAEARKDVLRTKTKNHIIDTCMAVDTGQWETGIEPKGKSWVIVEQYENKPLAIKGHKKWVRKIRKHPKTKLEDVLDYGL